MTSQELVNRGVANGTHFFHPEPRVNTLDVVHVVTRQRAKQLAFLEVTLTDGTHHVTRLRAAAGLHAELERGQIHNLAYLCGADTAVLRPDYVIGEQRRGLWYVAAPC